MECKTTVLIVLVMLLLGCRSKPSPTILTLDITASYDINRIRSSLASPLQIRLYELSSKTLFEQTDFLDIYLQDASVLQDSLVKKHQLPVLRPGEHRQEIFQLNNATRYIGVLGEFANYNSAVSRDAEAIIKSVNNAMTLFIEENRLRLVNTPDQ